jgi:hypothetical protein
LQAVQSELRQEKLLVNVELLGINRLTDNDDNYNYMTTKDNVLPWLQDTAQVNAWSLWDVGYRDLIILDSSNRVTGIINLTYNDLALSTNRARLKEMLRRAANAGDNDGDKLPDHWEYRSFGNLSASPADDSDGDGFNNLVELAFGTDPKDSLSRPQITLGFSSSKQFRASFDRWAGSALDYLVESSTNLLEWSGSAVNIRSATTNHYDGTGRSRATFNLVRSSTLQPSGFVRINARPKP